MKAKEPLFLRTTEQVKLFNFLKKDLTKPRNLALYEGTLFYIRIT